MGLITLLMLPPRATQRIKIRLVTALVNAALNKHLNIAKGTTDPRVEFILQNID